MRRITAIKRIALGGGLLATALLLASMIWPGDEESGTVSGLDAVGDSISFNRHVQPILSRNCYQCHGPDSHAREADLRLDREEFAFEEREDGPVIVRGAPDESPLVRRIESTNPNEMMPPPDSHRSLDPSEIALLRRWVKEGAEYQEHWAFVRPDAPDPPEVRREDWIRSNIDRFVLARLEEAGLTGSAEADRYALIRRVAFDLTGLPPSPEEIRAFLSDDSPDAYERLVDRLLESPRYGEHRARYWLDAVRYGDTHGLHYDNYRVNWPYRDYVIRSYNENKPFDEFAVEQIAGDLLPAENIDQLIATGFNRQNLTSSEAGVVPEELQLMYVTDRVETFGAVFMGLTMACASCHDHKFDPVSRKEFYSFSAFFNNSTDRPMDQNLPSPWPSIPVPSPEKLDQANAILGERAAVERKLRERRDRVGELIGDWLAAGGTRSLNPVSTDALIARFRFDEGEGKAVHNSAPGADPVAYVTSNQKPFWRERVHHWPTMRFAATTELEIGQLGDFERTDAFSLAAWLKGREGMQGREGALFSKMSIEDKNRGWDLYWSDAGTTDTRHAREGQLVVNLVHEDGTDAISVRTVEEVSRYEWAHVALTYDGWGTADGVRIYINGNLQEVEVLSDNLSGTIRTSAPFQFGRRTGGAPFRETGYQDFRLYARELSHDEVLRTMYEDVVHEVVARPMEEWDVDAFKLVADHYLRTIDEPAIALRAKRAQLDQRLAEISRGNLTDPIILGGPEEDQERNKFVEVPREVRALIFQERDTLPIAYDLDRGVYTELGERVGPGVPEFLPALPEGRQDRLGLARWLVSPEHPLLARVTVNRMWQELFGAGIVDTVGDFGIVGASPSHPELLDWLAADFRDSGWDVKRFYKQVVMSAAYRQSARVTPEMLELDPDNRLFSRGPRFRMDAEMIRDSALAAGGLLVEEIGGPGVHIYQPPGIWEEVSLKSSNTRVHPQGTGDDLYRRSIYTFWKRTSPPPLLATFDAPQRDVCVVERDRTNTPLQALAVLNSPDFLEAARRLAERAMRLPDAGVGAKIDHMSMLLLTRPPPADQRAVLEESFAAFRKRFSDTEAARIYLAVGDSPVPEDLLPADLAAWAVVARQLLNTDQALNK